MSRLICRLWPRPEERQDVAAAFGLALSDRDDEFDLHRYSAGQRAHADGRARVAAAVAEHLDKKIGAAVDHLRVILEIGRGIDHAEHLDDVLDAIEIAAERIPHRRDQHQRPTCRAWPY